MVSEQEINKKPQMENSQMHSPELLIETISNLIDLYKAYTNQNQNSNQPKNFGVEPTPSHPKGEENPKSEEPKEGCNLLGKPKFKKLENGRLKCVETDHELPAHAREAYAVSKHCLLDSVSVQALSKPTLCPSSTKCQPPPAPSSPCSRWRATWPLTPIPFPTPKKTSGGGEPKFDRFSQQLPESPPVSSRRSYHPSLNPIDSVNSIDISGGSSSSTRRSRRQQHPSQAGAPLAAEVVQRGRRKKRRRREIWASGEDRTPTADQGAARTKVSQAARVSNTMREPVSNNPPHFHKSNFSSSP